LRAERQKAMYVDDFRKNQQGKDKAREYDLNDPLSKLKDLPGRVGDEDSRLSVSGMQQFHGEDLDYARRMKLQQEELRQWSDELSAKKAAARAHEKALDDAFAERAMQVDQMKTDLEATARAARTATSVAMAEYQLAQAAAKRERETSQQKAELQDNVEEITNNLSSDLLTENPAVGRSFMAPNRLRPDHYKGMTPMEQQAVREAQATQREMNLAKEKATKHEEASDAATMEATRRAGAYQDAQVAAMRAEMRKKLMEDNLDLASQQFASNSFLKTNVFTNAIDASFFDQFGTCSR